MPLSSLSSLQLKGLVKLVGKKEKLQAQIGEIDRALSALDGAKPALPRSASKSRAPRKRRGALKNAVLEKLRAAGKSGLTTKELGASLGAKPASIYAWFYTTGKKIAGIKKVGRAKFAYLPE